MRVGAGSGKGNEGASDDLGVQDPGAVRERTQLAWTRSGLAVAVTVAIIIRHLWPLTGNKAVAALAVGAAGATLWTVAVNIGRSNSGRADAGSLDTSACRLMTIGTLGLAAAGLIISFVSA